MNFYQNLLEMGMIFKLFVEVFLNLLKVNYFYLFCDVIIDFGEICNLFFISYLIVK